jgi:hypothetical protein
MPTSLVSTGVKFPDNSIQTTAGGAPTTAQVGTATAGLAGLAVGSYTIGLTGDALANGATVAGNTMLVSNCSGENFGQTGTGTWRCMGRTASSSAVRATTIFLRIA